MLFSRGLANGEDDKVDRENLQDSEEFGLTRKQVLFRLAISVMVVAIVLMVVAVVLLVRYLDSSIDNYEVVDATVIEYEEKSAGVEGFPKAPYNVDRFATVKYGDYVTNYELTDSYAPQYKAAYETKTTVSVYLYKGKLYESEARLRAVQNKDLGNTYMGFMIFALISIIADVYLWVYYKKEG